MKTLFIDESGDLGTKERYFVIAMLVPQRSKRIVNFMRRFIAQNGLSEVKGTLLTTPQKQNLIHQINTANDCVISYIVVDKNNISNPKLLQDKNIMYNYLLSFLFKNTIKHANEDISILLDNHTIKVGSINSLADYIKIKAYTQWGFKYNIHVGFTDSKHSKMIQAADVVANAIYAKYIYGKNHLYNRLTINESIRFPFNIFGK